MALLATGWQSTQDLGLQDSGRHHDPASEPSVPCHVAVPLALLVRSWHHLTVCCKVCTLRLCQHAHTQHQQANLHSRNESRITGLHNTGTPYAGVHHPHTNVMHVSAALSVAAREVYVDVAGAHLRAISTGCSPGQCGSN